MSATRSRLGRACGPLLSVLAAGLLFAPPAHSIGGGDDSPGNSEVLATIVTNGRACSGVLIAPQWLATSSSCFAADPGNPGTVLAGPPPAPTRARIGQLDSSAVAGSRSVSGFNGYDQAVVKLVPRTDRDLVLAQLDAPVGFEPVPLAHTAPAQGDTVRVEGRGRTTGEWVPVEPKGGTMSVTSVTASTLAIDGPATICKGDSGGPAYRQAGTGVELVAVHSRSWQHGCLAETETRTGAVESRVDNITDWITAITKPPCAAGRLIANPGFEAREESWTATASVIVETGPDEPSHTGSWAAWLDGFGSEHTDTLSQTVTIPPGCTATLSFWLHVDTAETDATAEFDTLAVQAGPATLATYSNLDSAAGYQQRTIDVTPFAGQAVPLTFTGTEDSSLQTSFLVDDVALDVH